MGRSMKRLALGCILCAQVAFAQEQPEADEGLFGIADPEMLAAVAQARDTLDQFLALAANPEPGTSAYKLKVVVRDGEKIEPFWVMPFQVDENGFEGTLANSPVILGNVSLGETIRFTRDDVIDWGYLRNGRQAGSFTVCVLFKHIPKQQADYFRKYNGFDC